MTAENKNKFLYYYFLVQLQEKYCRSRRKLFWQTTDDLVEKVQPKEKHIFTVWKPYCVILRNEDRVK